MAGWWLGRWLVCVCMRCVVVVMVEEEKEEEEEGLAIAGQADVSASWACQQFWQADSSAGSSRLATGPGREIAPFTFVHHSALTSQ